MQVAAPAVLDALLAKPRLSIAEITTLLAAAVSGLPTVRKVAVVDGTELAVALTCGSHIEVQALPIAARMNGTTQDRRSMIDDVLARCA